MKEHERDELQEVGRKAKDLVMPGCDWVHRRVQRVSYLEPQLVQVRLSVDFTPPVDSGPYVPISVLPKWPPLYRFDFRRSDDTPVPLLTSSQNGAADESLLNGLVEDVSPQSLNDPAFREALRSLALGTATDLAPVVDVFESGLQGDDRDPLIERVLDIAAMLADATLLWYPVNQAERGVRTICKLDYLVQSPADTKWYLRLLRSLSWYQRAEYIPLTHIGADANFHAEVEAPPVLTIRSIEPRYYWLEEGEEAQEEDENEINLATEDAEKAGLRPQENLEREGRLAHVYVSGRRPLGADLVVGFAPSRTGVVLSAFIAAVLAAILATSFYCWRDTIRLESHIDAAVAVLILVPALIGYVVIRPSDHPLARRYIFGTQILSLAASGIPLLMAVLLLRFAGDPSCLKTAWLWSMVGSWLLALMLLGSLMGAGFVSGEDFEDD